MLTPDQEQALRIKALQNSQIPAGTANITVGSYNSQPTQTTDNTPIEFVTTPTNMPVTKDIVEPNKSVTPIVTPQQPTISPEIQKANDNLTKTLAGKAAGFGKGIAKGLGAVASGIGDTLKENPTAFNDSIMGILAGNQGKEYERGAAYAQEHDKWRAINQDKNKLIAKNKAAQAQAKSNKYTIGEERMGDKTIKVMIDRETGTSIPITNSQGNYMVVGDIYGDTVTAELAKNQADIIKKDQNTVAYMPETEAFNKQLADIIKLNKTSQNNRAWFTGSREEKERVQSFSNDIRTYLQNDPNNKLTPQQIDKIVNILETGNRAQRQNVLDQLARHTGIKNEQADQYVAKNSDNVFANEDDLFS